MVLGEPACALDTITFLFLASLQIIPFSESQHMQMIQKGVE